MHFWHGFTEKGMSEVTKDCNGTMVRERAGTVFISAVMYIVLTPNRLIQFHTMPQVKQHLFTCSIGKHVSTGPTYV